MSVANLQEQMQLLADRLPQPTEEVNTKKVQFFTMLLYTEDDHYNINEVLDKIRSLSEDKGWSYSMILHDKDFYTEETFDDFGHLLGHMGDLKKPHYHVVIATPYAVAISDIATWLGIAQRFIDNLKNTNRYKGMILYLTHINHPEKFQYPIGDVESNVSQFCHFLFNSYEIKPDIHVVFRDYACPLNTRISRAGWYNYIMDNYPQLYPEVKKEWYVFRDVIPEMEAYNIRNAKRKKVIDTMETLFPDLPRKVVG